LIELVFVIVSEKKGDRLLFYGFDESNPYRKEKVA